MSYPRPRFLIALMVGLLFTELAWAQDMRWKTDPSLPSGIHGPNATDPWQYGHPATIYTYPPVITVPVIPKAYMDRKAREMRESNWQFYCRNNQTYFPYVRDCPEGWEVVNLPPDLR